MAFEAYSVAVKLSLINHVSAGMALISKSLHGTGQDVDALNAKLKSIGKQGAIGGVMFAGGLGLAAMFKAPLDEAKKFQNETERFRSLGLGDKVTADAVQFAKGMDTYGTSIRENLGLLRDAQTVFGDFHEAKMVTPLLSKMKFANAALYGDEGGGIKDKAFMDMLKVIEMRGGLASEGAFTKQANMIQQVLTATGGRVGANEYLNFIKTGGVAAKGLKDENFYYNMEPLIQEMGGSRSGTGYMSAYQNLIQGRTTQRAATELMRIGMLDPKMVDYDKIGNIKQIKPGAAKGQDQFIQAPFQWMQEVLLPAFAAKGITKGQDILNEFGAIFSNRTAAQFFSTMYAQQASIEKNMKLNSGAAGVDELNENAKKTLSGREIELSRKWKDLLLALGDVVLPLAIKAMDKLIPALKELNKWMGANPETVKSLTYALMGLSAFLVTGGLINMVIAAGRGFLLLSKIFLLANPIGLAIAAIALAAYAVWNNWKEISGALKIIWSDIKTGIVQLFHGDIAGAFQTFKGVFLLYWQTLFNTLIAGMNTILPAAFQMQKFHFGDKPRTEWGRKDPLVVPVPGKRDDYGNNSYQFFLDGKQLTDVVVKRMARAASAPLTGAQGFDLLRSPVMPGTPSAVYPRG